MKGITQIWKDLLKKSRIYKVKREVDNWYATHTLSIYQKKNVNAIRDDYEKKIDKLQFEYEKAHHNITLVFLEHELAYLNASHAEKEAKQKEAEPLPARQEDAQEEKGN